MNAKGTAARSAAATVLSDGTIEIGSRAIAHRAEGPSRWAALVCLAPLAAFVPAWAVTPMKAGRRVASLLASAALLIVVLHAVAAGRVGPWCGALAAAPLCVAMIVARKARGL